VSAPEVAVLAVRGLEFGWSPGASLIRIDSLDVARGERVFVHGPSGSGKSTLLGLIAGIHLPRRGSVLIQGRDTRSLSRGGRDALRGTEMGFVFQQFNLLPYLSVVDNVLLPLTFSADRRRRAGGWPEGRRQAIDLLRRLGMAALLERQPGALSVGQQQRVAVARALLGAPPLVLCDEPTSALDEQARDDFMELLLAECERSQAALLFVSHDRDLMPRFDRRLALRGAEAMAELC